LPAGRQVSPEQHSYDWVQARPDVEQHWPASDVESRSQRRPVPHDMHTAPRSPHAVSVCEAGGTHAPVWVQQPRQVVVLHFDWQVL
jgi:hypothetical protein